jgi:hypothetical protein
LELELALELPPVCERAFPLAPAASTGAPSTGHVSASRSARTAATTRCGLNVNIEGVQGEGGAACAEVEGVRRLVVVRMRPCSSIPFSIPVSALDSDSAEEPRCECPRIRGERVGGNDEADDDDDTLRSARGGRGCTESEWES